MAILVISNRNSTFCVEFSVNAPLKSCLYVVRLAMWVFFTFIALENLRIIEFFRSNERFVYKFCGELLLRDWFTISGLSRSFPSLKCKRQFSLSILIRKKQNGDVNVWNLRRFLFVMSPGVPKVKVYVMDINNRHSHSDFA